MKTKRLSAIILALVVAWGCGDLRELPAETPVVKTPETAPPPSAEPVPIEGGVISLAMNLPKTLNPLLNEDAGVDEILRLVYEPLAVFGEGMRPEPNSALVESVNFSEDYASLTVTLRDGAFWSDGAAITAEDVYYSLKTLIEDAGENAVYKHCAEHVREASVISAKVLRVDYDSSRQGALYDLMFPVVPAGATVLNLLEHLGESALPVGNGIYKFREYWPSESLTLSASSAALRPRPKIDEIRVDIVRDSAAIPLGFEQGLTSAAVFGLDGWSRLLGKNGARAYAFGSTYFDYIGFNFTGRISLALREVRLSVSHCLPDDLAGKFYLNRAARAVSPVSPDSWLYDAESAALPAFSVEAAYNVLYDAGFTDADRDGVLDRLITGPDGLDKRENLSFRILYNIENDIRAKIAAELKLNLEKTGFAIELDGRSFEEYQAALEAGDFDIFVGGIILSDKRPDFRFMFGEGGERNYGAYRSDEMDALLDNIDAAQTPREYMAAYAEFQAFIAAELPIIGAAFRFQALMTAKNIFGCENVGANGFLYNMNEWYFAE